MSGRCACAKPVEVCPGGAAGSRERPSPQDRRCQQAATCEAIRPPMDLPPIASASAARSHSRAHRRDHRAASRPPVRSFGSGMRRPCSRYEKSKVTTSMPRAAKSGGKAHDEVCWSGRRRRRGPRISVTPDAVPPSPRGKPSPSRSGAAGISTRNGSERWPSPAYTADLAGVFPGRRQHISAWCRL